MMEKENLLKIEHLYKTFGITKANNNVSIEIAKGEIRSLSGENGPFFSVQENSERKLPSNFRDSE